MPPEKENKALSWPHWPLKLRVSSSQAEGAKVEYSISTTGFAGKNGKVEKLLYTRVDSTLKPVPGSEGELPADLVLFAMGFSGPVEDDVVKELGLAVVPRGRFKGLDANERDYRIKGSGKVFAAGDIRRGQSPRRVGHPRGPPGRARHRPLPDGPQRSAALRVASRAAGLHARLANTPRFLPSWRRASRPRADAGGRLEGHAWSER